MESNLQRDPRAVLDILYQKKEYEKVKILCKKLLSADKKSTVAINFLGLCSIKEGNYLEADKFINQLVKLEPKNPIAFNNLGMAQYHLKRYSEAFKNFTKAIHLAPKYVTAQCNLGRVCYTLGKKDDAILAYQRAIDIDSQCEEAYSLWAKNLVDDSKYHEAIVFYDKAISIAPKNIENYFSQAEVYDKQAKTDLALHNYQQILQIDPKNIKAILCCGHAHRILKQYEKAIEKYNQYIEIDSEKATIFFNLALCQKALGKIEEAILSYQKAIALKSDYVEAKHNVAVIYHDLKKFDLAIQSYDAAFHIDPKIGFLIGNRAYSKSSMCQWDGHELMVNQLTQRLKEGVSGVIPFPYLALVDDPALQQKASTIFMRMQYPNKTVSPSIEGHLLGEKIRIAYFTADFHNHAIPLLMTEFFGLHSRQDFEVIAFSFDMTKEDQFRKRLRGKFDQFLEVGNKGDAQIAALARSMKVDIAIDLMGHTQKSRPGIFLERAAPIQVNYLGYPGTMGTKSMDYIIVDKIVIPEENKIFFSEKMVFMPDSYQVNDKTRPLSSKNLTRKDVGLPENAFVYSCFNNNYKIIPATFDSWAAILKTVPNSVLWLFKDNEFARDNLIKELDSRGVDKNRLIFANRMSLPEHLSRQRLADLFLDTLPYNAHTTASDALWVGLPLLTLMGKSFPARVAASLLKAVNLEELITYSRQEFESLAIELGTNPKKLQLIREKLSTNRETMPLFDTQTFVRNIELAYKEMINLSRSNKGPKDIDVAKLIISKNPAH